MASFFIKKHKKMKWSLWEQSYENKKSTQTLVPKNGYETLGVHPDWSIDQAKERVRLLNKSNKEKRKENHSFTKAARNQKRILELSSIYAPDNLSLKFIEKIKTESFGTSQHREKLVSHFKYVQKLVAELKLEANEFVNNKQRIYHYFIDDAISLDYVGKLVRMLNYWAKFVCKERRQFFEPLEIPRGQVRSAIEDSYLDGEGFIGESNPLTMEELLKVRAKLTIENYNWLYLTIWLGLRPGETDGLHDEKTWRLNVERDVEIINVYMPKLTGLSRDKRWKPIPLIFPEQKECLIIARSKIFKFPTAKTMNQYFSGITKYGGRKGFVDLMLNKGQVLEDISVWLGHQSIETTWQKYRNKKRVNWTKPS